MRYPTSLENADVTEYNHALQLLGGENNMMVPLWWAIK
nr:SusD/RagB family nutrient-binding outer membrane lipoprotein [uncultured Bacteroides sp.]